MKKAIKLLGFLFIVLMIFSGCGGSNSSNNINTPDSNFEINQLLDRLQTAMKNEDINQVLSYYSEPFQMNGTPYTHSAYQSELQTLFQSTNFLTYEYINRQQVTLTDSTHANISCVCHIKKSTNEENSVNYSFTLVKKTMGWEICTVLYTQPNPNPEPTYTFVQKWGYTGSGEGFFNTPVGIALYTTLGNLYITDLNNYRVQCFDIGGNSLSSWGSNGIGNGQFGWLGGIAVDNWGNVYVVDGGNGRIQKFDYQGNYIAKWGGFAYPADVTVDTTGNVYVTDYQNNCVKKFDSSGNLLTQWGNYGTGDGQFHNPIGIAVKSGYVYVVDSKNNRIQKFDSDGNFISTWGSYGTGNREFNNPNRITVDSSANVFVTDYDNNRVLKFDSNGGFITKFGSFGSDDGQFKQPSGIVVDSSNYGHVYVVDSGNNRIQEFALSQ